MNEKTLDELLNELYAAESDIDFEKYDRYNKAKADVEKWTDANSKRNPLSEEIKPEKNNLYCDHLRDNPSVVYLYAWAGDNTRMCLCRLCTTMMLGTIVSGRIEDVLADHRLREVDRREP